VISSRFGLNSPSFEEFLNVRGGVLEAVVDRRDMKIRNKSYSSLFNEFVPKKTQFTHERVEYIFLFEEPLKGSKWLKVFKICSFSALRPNFLSLVACIVLATVDLEEIPLVYGHLKTSLISCTPTIGRSNEILGWGGVGNRQLLCFF
jgi:hypothetical protein